MLSRFWNLFRRRRLDIELDAELAHHLDHRGMEVLLGVGPA